MRYYCIVAGTLCITLAACHTPSPNTDKPDILSANLDTSVHPGDDFFDYANGGWIKKNPIPGDQSGWGIGNLVQEELYARLRTINVQAIADKGKGGISQKIADFWQSGLDSTGIDKEGLRPLKPELDAINGIQTTSDLLKVVADFHTKGMGPLLDEGVAQDSKKSDVMAYYLSQGGLGLPNRDYYFNTDARTANIRSLYPGHVSRMLQLAGYDSVRAIAASAAILKLETRLAFSSRKLEDLRDPYRNYNKFAVGDLKSLSPVIDWKDWLHHIGIEQLDSAIVGQPEFFKALNAALQQESIATWKDYLTWHLIHDNANLLSKPFADEQFNFFGKTMRGLEKMKPRWKRVLDTEEGAMGEALGQLFVKEYFNDKAKKRYEDMVEGIRAALKKRIENLNWMGDSTKQKALYKLSKMRKKVGYPDKWKDFSAMKIEAQPYVRNVLVSRQWWFNYSVHKLGKPVDREEWDMTPQTYNAYYNPSNNEIVLPAGIFTVPGLRDEELDDALVYGYGGASTIGHEITHGFDDEGRQFDADGNLKGWWTAKDSIEFSKRSDVMVRQFNHYVPVDSLHINGKATLGENIADLGGVLLGWDAFRETSQFKKGEKIAGLTPQQRYFLGYALGWLGHTRKEQLAQQLLTDVHSPAKYRVNGPFADVNTFYEVFGVQPSQAMYLPDSARVRIW